MTLKRKKMTYLIKKYTALVFIIVSTIAKGNDIYVGEILEVNAKNIEYRQVVSANFDIDSARHWRFVKANSKTLNLEPSEKGYFCKFSFINNSDYSHIALQCPITTLDEMKFYVMENDVYKEVSSEDDPYYIFKFEAGIGKECEVAFYVESKNMYVIPLQISNETELESSINIRNILIGSFLGIMLTMFLYNLILFSFTRDSNYVSYLVYIIGITMGQIALLGFSHFIFPSNKWIYDIFLYLGSSIAGVFGALFVFKFLQVRKESRWMAIGLGIVILSYLAVAVTYFQGLFLTSYVFIQVSGMLGVIIILAISIRLSFKGNSAAKIYLIAWSALLISIVVYVLKDNGILTSNNFTNFSVSFGVILETIFISLALANNITVMRQEKDNANQRLIDQIEKNEEFVRDQNIVLERKVIERTAALQKALDELKAAQFQLVQSEKMASLGTLTAGIAHEINNPINFVSANVLPLRDNIEDLTKLIEQYKGINESNFEIELLRLSEVEKEMDLEYTLVETKQLIDGIEEGANRTHTIVQGLTSFSRGDSSKKSKADINRGIRSTVSVLKSRLNNVNLIMDLDNNLPLVSCQIGKINQVVLNLMNNALDALVEKNGTNRKESQLRVETKGLGHSVQISISDNANGIEKELQPKIMEPFYTTKPVGKGTGLGLSISYSIIEDHGGAIELDSEEGVGTKFIITLPLVS